MDTDMLLVTLIYIYPLYPMKIQQTFAIGHRITNSDPHKEGWLMHSAFVGNKVILGCQASLCTILLEVADWCFPCWYCHLQQSKLDRSASQAA